MHLRKPENIQGIALLKRPGVIKTDDFLDCIDKDTPKGLCLILFSLFFTYFVLHLFTCVSLH
jgi:hypothetical protein